MKHIERTTYLEILKKVNNTPDIKVITGIRRSGKTVLMQDYIDYVVAKETNANIIMINLQEVEFDNLLEYHALHEYVMSKYMKGMHNLVFIDEVQLCDKFELAINSLHSKGIFEREYAPLLAIRDAYSKIIIARTHHEMYKYEGILVYDIAKWLVDTK